MKLILASQSPRRSQLLQGMGYGFDIQPSTEEEKFDENLAIDEALKQVAETKARNVLQIHPESVILAADTIVYDQGKVLGKPQDVQEAFDTLKSLSGRDHSVKTAVVVMAKGHLLKLVQTTKVFFKNLSDDQIWEYVNKKTCLDKAGSYGIQDVDFVDHLEGSYSNVVGLPMIQTDQMLKLIQHDPKISF